MYVWGTCIHRCVPVCGAVCFICVAVSMNGHVHTYTHGTHMCVDSRHVFGVHMRMHTAVGEWGCQVQPCCS